MRTVVEGGRGWRAALALVLASSVGAFSQAAVAAQEPAPQDSAPREEGADEGPWLVFPDAPFGRLWSSVGPETEPWARMRDSRAIPGAGPAEPWASWARALRSIDAGEDVREATLLLVRLAAEDRRGDDAYRWVETFGAGDAGALAGSLPYLFPGVPLTTRLGAGGVPVKLEEGVRLRPLLPPATEADLAQGIVWREARARDLVVGTTTFDLLLKLDGSGVVIEFENVEGPPVRVVVELPAPRGFRLKSLYRDWELAAPPEGADPASFDWAGVPIELDVQAGELETSAFARLERIETRLPASPSGALPNRIEEAGLELAVPPGDTGPWDAIAAAFALATGVDVTVTREPGPRTAAEGMTPVRIDLAASPTPTTLRRDLTSAIEGRARARLQ